jgi:hypothetical protein
MLTPLIAASPYSFSRNLVWPLHESLPGRRRPIYPAAALMLAASGRIKVAPPSAGSLRAEHQVCRRSLLLWPQLLQQLGDRLSNNSPRRPQILQAAVSLATTCPAAFPPSCSSCHGRSQHPENKSQTCPERRTTDRFGALQIGASSWMDFLCVSLFS